MSLDLDQIKDVIRFKKRHGEGRLPANLPDGWTMYHQFAGRPDPPPPTVPTADEFAFVDSNGEAAVDEELAAIAAEGEDDNAEVEGAAGAEFDVDNTAMNFNNNDDLDGKPFAI